MNVNRTPDWRDRLVAAHPTLFDGGPGPGVGRIDVSVGWHDIVETMLARIATALSATAGNFVTVESVESKHGGLLVHLSGLVTDDGVRAAVDQAVDLAEARSATTCEHCGAEGRLFETEMGWLITACEDHGRGSVPIETGVQPGLVVKRSVGGAIISCRRYDKAADRFVDIDPRDVGLEE
jgi:hypothetical protein